MATAEGSPKTSILQAAMVVAHRARLPAISKEANLTWRSMQLAEVVKLLAREGDLARAEELVRELGKPPSVGCAALAELGIAAVKRGRHDQADRVVERLARLDVWTSASEIAEIARAYTAAGQEQKAIRLTARIDSASERYQLLLDLGEAAARAGRRTAGLELLDRAVRHAAEIQPRSELALWLDRGDTRLNLQSYTERLQAFERLTEAFVQLAAFDRARAIPGKIAEVADADRDHSGARAWLSIARGLQEHADNDAARLSLNRALEASAAASLQRVGDHKGRIRLLIAAARLLGKMGETEAAREQLAQATVLVLGLQTIDDLPLRVGVGVAMNVELAGAYQDLGEPGTAKALLVAATELADSLEPGGKSMGTVAPANHNNPTRGADQAEVLARLASGYARAGVHPTEERLLERCLATARTIGDDQWRASAWKRIAQAYLANGEPQRALQVLLREVQPDLQQTEALLDIYHAFRRQRQQTQAARVLSLLPASWAKTQLQTGLANELVAAGDRKSAQQLIVQALQEIVQGKSTAEGKGAGEGRIPWDRQLILIANEYVAAGDPTGPQTADLLRILLQETGKAALPERNK